MTVNTVGNILKQFSRKGLGCLNREDEMHYKIIMENFYISIRRL